MYTNLSLKKKFGFELSHTQGNFYGGGSGGVDVAMQLNPEIPNFCPDIIMAFVQ